MRIHEVEIYTAKQIRAFIEYLNVLADEKEAQEEQQKMWIGNASLAQGQCIGGLGAAQAIPEYMAKVRAQAIAEANAATPPAETASNA